MSFKREFATAVLYQTNIGTAFCLLMLLFFMSGCFGERAAVDERESGQVASPGNYFLVDQRLPIFDRTGMVLASTSAGSGRKTGSRNYPWGDLARSVIGGVDKFGRGISGIEYRFDSMLAPGLKDSLPKGEELGLYLSLDIRLQQQAERLLEWQANRLKAARGSLIVMDLRTGEILSLANFCSATVDSNSVRLQRIEQDHAIPVNISWACADLAIEDLADPWPILLMMEMERQLKAQAAAEMQRIESEQAESGDRNESKRSGKDVSAGRKEGKDPVEPAVKIKGWHWAVFARDDQDGSGDEAGALWTRADAEQLSALFSEAFQDERQERILSGIISLGFGQKTGVELPDEALGSVPSKFGSDLHIQARSGIKATPLQILVAFSRLLTNNNGLQPTILAKTGSNPPKLSSEAGDNSLAAAPKKKFPDLRALLSSSTGLACASVRKNKGFEVLSMGFWPVKEPRIALISVLWDTVHDPRIRRGTLGRCRSLLIYADEVATGSMAVDTVSKESTTAAGSSHGRKIPQGLDRGRMPDLSGQSLRHAFEIIQSVCDKAEIIGTGRVVSQLPAPGTPLGPGTLCRVYGKQDRS